MNEYQLLIGETTYGGRREFRDPDGIMDYGSLIYIALQRCKTAREAIVLIDELMQTYGYASGESLPLQIRRGMDHGSDGEGTQSSGRGQYE